MIDCSMDAVHGRWQEKDSDVADGATCLCAAGICGLVHDRQLELNSRI